MAKNNVGKKPISQEEYTTNKVLAVFALAAAHAASDALFHAGDGGRAFRNGLHDFPVGYLLAATNDYMIVHSFTSNERCLST